MIKILKKKQKKVEQLIGGKMNHRWEMKWRCGKK